MANETDSLDYVHPIIQAMIAASAAGQQQQELKQKKVTDAEQAQVRQQQLKLEQQRIDNESAASHAAHDLMVQNIEHTRAQEEFKRKIELLGKAQELVSNGTPASAISAPSGNPNGSQIINIPGLGSINIDPNLLQTADQRGRQEITQAAAKAKAIAEVQQPFDLAKLGVQGQNQLAQTREQGVQRQKEIDQTEAGNLLRTKLQGENALAVAKEATFRTLAAAKIRLSNVGKDLGEQTVNSYINDAYVTGNISNIPVKYQPAVRGALPEGWTPISKPDQTKFDGIPLVNDLINKGLTLAKQSAEGYGQRAAAATGYGFLGSAGETRQQVDALLGNISRVFGGERGVLTQKDIDRAKGLIFSLSNTDDQNSQKVQDLKKIFKDSLSSTLNKYPEDQLTNILIHRGVDPAEFKGGQSNTPAKTRIEISPGQFVEDNQTNRLKYGIH